MIDIGRTEYTTWVDFTERMQCTTVSQEDWALFYKRYYGFIVGYCQKRGWQDLTQEILDRCVLKFNDESIKKIRHDHPGSLRAWLHSVIHRAFADIMRKRGLKENSIYKDLVEIDLEGKVSVPKNPEEKDGPVTRVGLEASASDIPHGSDPIENQAADLGWSDEELEQSFILYLAIDTIKTKTPPIQFQTFVWRKCQKRSIGEIAQATGCTPKQAYEYSRLVEDKLKNQIKKFGEKFPARSSKDWNTLLQRAQEGQKYFRAVADEFSTRCVRCSDENR